MGPFVLIIYSPVLLPRKVGGIISVLGVAWSRGLSSEFKLVTNKLGSAEVSDVLRRSPPIDSWLFGYPVKCVIDNIKSTVVHSTWFLSEFPLLMISFCQIMVCI